MTCICESASQSSLFDKSTKVVFKENSSATGSDTCCARIGNVKSTAALGLPKNMFNPYPSIFGIITERHIWKKFKIIPGDVTVRTNKIKIICADRV